MAFLEDIFQRVEDEIRSNMKERFGLSDEETQRTSDIIRDKVRNAFSEEQIKNNLQQFRETLGQFAGKGKLSGLEHFNNELVSELKEKVGLSEETAQKVREFSVTKLFEELRQEFTGEDGKLDLSRVLALLNLPQLESGAKEWLGNFGKYFKK